MCVTEGQEGGEREASVNRPVIYQYMFNLFSSSELMLSVCISLCVWAVCKEQEPKAKRLKEVEAFVLSEQQRSLIQEDHGNKKVWDEALGFLTEGPVCINTPTHVHFNSNFRFFCIDF